MSTRARSLTSRLLRFLSLTVVATAASLVIAAFLLFRQLSLDAAFHQAGWIVEQKEREISRFFSRIEILVRSLAGNETVIEQRYQAMADLFAAIALAKADTVSSIYFGSGDGRFLQRGWGSPILRKNAGWAWRNLPFRPAAAELLPEAYDPRLRPWYQQASSNAGFIVTEPYPFVPAPNAPAAWGITAAIPVTNRNGAPIGVLGVDCGLSLLEGFATNLHLPADGTLLLLDSLGNLLDSGPGTSGLSKDVLQKVIAGLPQSSDHSGHAVATLGGKSQLLSWRREPRSSLLLLAVCPTEALVQPVFNTFYPLAAAALLALTLLLAVAARGMRKLTGPVAELTETIERFRNRDFNARASIPQTVADSEIGKLAHTFNQMAESIKQYEQAMLARLYNDPLTGLPNRERLLLELASLHCPVVILVDIDVFKEINDFYGNTIGDFVLKEVAQRLQAAFPGMRAFRLSGDVYALLADRSGSDFDIDLSLQWVRMSIQNEPIHCKDQEIIVHVTCGAAIQDNRQQEYPHEEILLHADMALKRAKQKLLPGLVYQPELRITEEYRSNLSWVRRLKEALVGDRIVPVFQPIVDTLTGKADKYECLVRVRDADGSLLGPGAFLGIAHRARIYPELTRKMFARCFTRFENRTEDFSINLSMEDVRDPRTTAFLLETMRKAGPVTRRLVLELVESSEIEQNPDFHNFIRQAKKLGAQIAIDDFGAGYSNFSYLLEMKVDFIKIDASLIRNLAHDRNSQVVVRTIAGFARSLGIRTIAEFVDSREVHESVLGIGIDYCQGYYFGKPEPFLPGENPAIT